VVFTDRYSLLRELSSGSSILNPKIAHASIESGAIEKEVSTSTIKYALFYFAESDDNDMKRISSLSNNAKAGNIKEVNNIRVFWHQNDIRTPFAI